jgi:hypothetical protein
VFDSKAVKDFISEAGAAVLVQALWLLYLCNAPHRILQLSSLASLAAKPCQQHCCCLPLLPSTLMCSSAEHVNRQNTGLSAGLMMSGVLAACVAAACRPRQAQQDPVAAAEAA